MLSELPQDDYKSRYMISTKTIEFIFSEYEKASTIESEEKGSTCSVKKIGTNK